MQERLYFFLPPLIFLLSLGLTLGLTYAPCYSGECVETFFPFAARLHIATFYGILASVALALVVRASSDSARSLSELYLVRVTVPALGKRVSLGATLFAIWVVGFTLATTGFGWPLQRDFYEARGVAVDWTVGTMQLAITGVTGHYCDILVGLMVLPVSRNSMLGRVFRLSQSTLLFAHKILGYAALLAVVAHGVTYFSWIKNFAEADGERKDAFGIDNPTIKQSEAEARGPWGFIVLPSGGVSLVMFILIVITSLPKLRRASYNTFYYTHVIGSCLFFFLISIHASTDFYFLLPGLILWLFDWLARLRRLQKNTVEARVENAGNGWYRICIPGAIGPDTSEGATCPPLQAYYLNFPSISKLQCHAYTSSDTGGGSQGPSFLFRLAEGKTQTKLDKEWTWKLGKLVEANPGTFESQHTSTPTVSLPLRLEGPYVTPCEPLYTASHILCLVGGTGITGALCLAQSWLRLRASEKHSRFRIVWTVRGAEAARVAEMQELRSQMASRAINMEVMIHVSSEAGRVDPTACVISFFGPTELPPPVGHRVLEPACGNERNSSNNEKSDTAPEPKAPSKRDAASGWVYCSGPSGFLDATDEACLDLSRRLRTDSPEHGTKIRRLTWYCAKWEV